jgi:hypothetical protein
MVLECYALVWCCLWYNLVDFACYLVLLPPVWFSACLISGFEFYSDEDLLSIWNPVIMVWLYSFKSGLLIYICC